MRKGAGNEYFLQRWLACSALHSTQVPYR